MGYLKRRETHMSFQGYNLVRVAAAEIERLGGKVEDVTRGKHMKVWWSYRGRKFINTLPCTPRGGYDVVIRSQIRQKLKETV